MLQRMGFSQGAAKDRSMTEGAIRVLVGFPHEGMTPSQVYVNRLANMKYLGNLEARGALKNESPRFEFDLFSCGRMHVHVAREMMAEHCVTNGHDYLYMIDDDMVCDDHLFEKLYEADKDIVAPLAFTRNYPHKPVMYSCIEGFDPVIQKDHFTNYAVMKYPKDKLVRCDAVGFGAVLIKAKVLHGTKKPWFQNPSSTGEDIHFCYQARKFGFETWMDTRLKLGHVSHPIIVTEEYVEAQRKARGDADFNKIHSEYQKYATNGDQAREPILVLGE
jgi:hypothetical protein